MFCSQCGNKVGVEARFCSSCGSAVDASAAKRETLSFALSELRVPYGTGNLEMLPPDQRSADVVSIPADSDLVKTARTTFDKSRIPSDGDLVPMDCVWAFVKHPGEFPNGIVPYMSIDKKFVSMGTLRGRTFREIEEAAGPPMSKVAHMGCTNAVWGKTGFISFWQIALTFDPYGVCMGVYSENNF